MNAGHFFHIAMVKYPFQLTIDILEYTNYRQDIFWSIIAQCDTFMLFAEWLIITQND